MWIFVYIIPKIFLILLYLFFRKPIDIEFAFLFRHPKHNHSALAIGEGGISVPKCARKAP